MDKSDFSFFQTKRYKTTLCFSIILFFYLFLIFFLPFGVDNYNPNHTYTFSFLFEIFKIAFGVFVFSILNEFLFRSFILKRATLKHILLWSIWTLLLLSTVTFFVYNLLGNWHDFLFSSYLGFLINTSAVLLFPLTGTFFFFRYKSLHSQIEQIKSTREDIVDPNLLIHFKGQGSKDHIMLALSVFLFAKAQDNYVELNYLENNQLKKTLIRTSLSNLANSINTIAIKRCHRSYMVNLLSVKAIKGIKLEMTLFLEPFDTKVPVSNSYKDSILTELKKLKVFD